MVRRGLSGAVAVVMIMVMVMRAPVPAVAATMASRRIFDTMASGVMAVAVIVIMIPRMMPVMIRRWMLVIRAACFTHREPRSGQGMIGVIDARDACDRVEPGAFEGRGERRFELGPSVEHRRGEHVAGNPADRIKLTVHGCDVYSSRVEAPYTRHKRLCFVSCI